MKGGVGKSVIASWVASYLQDGGHEPECFDADAGNKTFSRFKGLSVLPVDLIRDGDVDPALYDDLIERVLVASERPRPVVIDTGSGSFMSLWNYINRNNLFELFAARGIDVVILVPIAAEPDLVDTIEGLRRIAGLSPNGAIALWLNQRGRRIEHGGHAVIDLAPVVASKEKIRGVVFNGRQLYDLHRDAVGKMLYQSAIFSSAEGLNTMETVRLQQVRDEVYEQLRGARL
jgi:hypothetical protein